MTRALTLAVAIAACHPLPHPPPPIDGANTAPIVESLAPAATLSANAGVPEYGTPTVALAADARTEQLAAHIASLAQGRPTLVRDPRIDRAATELAALVAQGAPLHDETVAFAMHEHGVIEAPTRVVTATAGTADEIDAQVAELATRPELRFGIGGAGPRVVIVTNPSVLTLTEPLPRALPAFGETQLDAQLDARMHAPHLAFTHEDGAVDRPEVSVPGPHRFHATLACGDHRGVQWLAIEACDAANLPVRLALLPIECGDAPEPTLHIEPSANLATNDQMHRLAAMINRERVARGFAPLRGDIRLDRVAREHAQRMAKAHEVSHQLGGTQTQRLWRASLYVPSTVETAFAAPDLGHIIEQIMNQPGYRSAIERGELTHLGVGLAPSADHQLYVALELATISPPRDEAEVIALVQQRVTAAIGKPISIDPKLMVIAHRVAELQAIGVTADRQNEYLELSTGFAYSQVGRAIAQVADEDHIDGTKLVWPHHFHKVGIGVYQDPPGGHSPGWIFIAVVYGKFDDHPPKTKRAGGPDI